MNAMMSLMARQWQARTDREQILLAVMAALVALVLAWLLAVRPLVDFHQRARSDYAASVGLYRDIEAGIARYDTLRAGGPADASASQSLRSIVGSMALRHGISIARLVPSDEGELAVNIDRAEARAVMAWLIELEERHGVQVVSSTLDRLGDDYVELHLVLRRRSV
tara:strand:+ start:9828 stop:10325 length:498 start_codon:yes stop_codon:yes gene_type:complete